MPETEESPASRLAKKLSKRTGPCSAAAVVCDCTAYAAVAGRVDGFATCVCAHTQWAHEEGTVDS